MLQLHVTNTAICSIADDGKYKTNKAETVVIYHPYMTNSHYQDMLSVWAELRLVE
eukprot:m.494696 g.494696  ORF g.494696 m.494696 type:complete len:55 (+) comp21796_c1_seq22:140-304(+)